MKMTPTRRLAIAAALLALAGLPPSAVAGTYPVTGQWGVSNSTEKGPIDCAKLRIIAFSGSQRTDSAGGVPGYRNRSVSNVGSNEYRVIDEFSTGQIGNGHVEYTLRRSDADHLELAMQKGGTLKLRKCK